MTDKVGKICHIARNPSNVGNMEWNLAANSGKILLTLCVLNMVYTCIMIFLAYNHCEFCLLMIFKGSKQEILKTKTGKEPQAKYDHNIFEGGLFIPMFGLIL